MAEELAALRSLKHGLFEADQALSRGAGATTVTHLEALLDEAKRRRINPRDIAGYQDKVDGFEVKVQPMNGEAVSVMACGYTSFWDLKQKLSIVLRREPQEMVLISDKTRCENPKLLWECGITKSAAKTDLQLVFQRCDSFTKEMNTAKQLPALAHHRARLDLIEKGTSKLIVALLEAARDDAIVSGEEYDSLLRRLECQDLAASDVCAVLVAQNGCERNDCQMCRQSRTRQGPCAFQLYLEKQLTDHEEETRAKLSAFTASSNRLSESMQYTRQLAIDLRKWP